MRRRYSLTRRRRLRRRAAGRRYSRRQGQRQSQRQSQGLQRGGQQPQAPQAPQASTFHILIATGGRPSLKNLLSSLKDELQEKDAVTIVFDGKDKKQLAGWSEDWIKGFKAPVAVLEEQENKGHWGHPIRTAYQGKLSPITTFVMHADDDDEYIPGFAHGLRQACVDPAKLYIARMISKSSPRSAVPSQFNEIKFGDIGTPCGIVPWAEAAKAEWPSVHGGDFKYYEKLGTVMGKDRIVFLSNIIYVVNK